jgi:hypothetical protein
MHKKRNTSMTTKESLSHQAPAGHKTADPTTAVRGPLAETEHQGASHAEEHVEDLDQAPEEEAYGSDAFSEVLTAEEVKKRGVEFASAVKFIATKYPDAKEAILILVQTAVEKIVKAGDLDAVVDELAEHFDSDIGLWYDLVSYLTSGEPKAAGLVRKIVELLMTSSTAPPSPSTLPPDKLVMDASVVSFKSLSDSSDKMPTFDPNVMISITDSRDKILTAAEPNYSVEVDVGMYGLYAVANSEFGSSIRNASKVA